MYYYILLTFITLELFLIAFFLFAMWRALLGKSSIDLRLSVSIDMNTKKLEALNKNFIGYSSTIDNLRHEMKEASRLLKDIKNRHEKNDRGNTSGTGAGKAKEDTQGV